MDGESWMAQVPFQANPVPNKKWIFTLLTAGFLMSLLQQLILCTSDIKSQLFLTVVSQSQHALAPASS